MAVKHPEEADLLRRIVAGDANAFKEIYNFYQGKIFAFAYYMAKSRDVAEEIVQEVFIKIWEKRDYIDPGLNFGAYLKKVTPNHMLNFLQRQAGSGRN